MEEVYDFISDMHLLRTVDLFWENETVNGKNSTVATTVCVGNLTETWHRYFCAGMLLFIGMLNIEAGFSGSYEIVNL
jgi:hypothetical protein